MNFYFLRRSSNCCLSFSRSITVSWVNFKSPSSFLFALSRSIRIFFSCSRDPSSLMWICLFRNCEFLKTYPITRACKWNRCGECCSDTTNTVNLKHGHTWPRMHQCHSTQSEFIHCKFNNWVNFKRNIEVYNVYSYCQNKASYCFWANRFVWSWAGCKLSDNEW